MREVIFLSSALAVLLCGAAWAAPAVLFENTIQVSMTDGRSGTVLTNADGTFTAKIPGMPSKGTWIDDSAKTCFVMEGETAKHCAAYPAAMKVGESIKDDDGNTLTLAAGR